MPREYPPPIDHGDFLDPKLVDAPPPPKTGFAIRSPFNRNVGNVVAQHVIAVESLSVTSARTGKSSEMSFNSDPGATIRSTSKEKRFHFAPEFERLTVKWSVKGAAHVLQTRVELYHRASAVPIWTVKRTYTPGQCPRSSKLTFDGTLSQIVGNSPEYVETRTRNYAQTDFPADVLTVKCSPYKLKVVIIGGLNTVRTVPARWLYLDVLLGEIKHAWGPKTLLAPSPVLPSNVLAVAPERDHHVYDSLTDQADQENLAGRIPQEGETKRVYLQSHRFYNDTAELTNNAAWVNHHALWGEGPNIPIVLTPSVRRSDDKVVTDAAAAKALAGLGFVWQWADAAEPAAPGLYLPPLVAEMGAVDTGVGEGHAVAFLNAKLDLEATTTTPPGKNTHVERGGKRGAGAPPVFPTPPNGPFPFTVSHPATGNWCAQTEVATTGAFAGRTGAIFQPSILAGDAYKLRVAAVYADYVDPSAVHGTFDTQMSAMPDELAVKFGTFQVWRSVAHSMYAVGLPSVPQADLDAFKLRLSKVYIHVANQVVSSAQYFAAVEQIYGGGVPGLPAFLQLALEDQAQTYSARAYGAYFRPWASWRDKMFQHHGTARAAYDFAKAFQSPILNYWRNDDSDDGTHPLIEPWPAQFAFQPLPQSGKIKVEIQAGHHQGVVRNKTFEFDQASQAQASTAEPFKDIATLLGAYVEGTDADMTVTIHCAQGDENAIQLAVTTAMTQEWARKSEERYKRSIAMAWAFDVYKLVADRLVTTRDGFRTAQFDYGRNHNIGAGPKGKALFANAQRASIDIFIFEGIGVFTTLNHEAGHALFVNHPNWDGAQAVNDPRHLHDAATRHCTMTTPSKGHNFCGFCMLRLRGWSIYKLDGARAPIDAVAPTVLDPYERTLTEGATAR